MMERQLTNIQGVLFKEKNYSVVAYIQMLLYVNKLEITARFLNESSYSRSRNLENNLQFSTVYWSALDIIKVFLDLYAP